MGVGIAKHIYESWVGEGEELAALLFHSRMYKEVMSSASPVSIDCIVPTNVGACSARDTDRRGGKRLRSRKSVP